MGELVDAPAGSEPELAVMEPSLKEASDFFKDGRDGEDRWGRPRRKLIVCGTGWGPDEYVCPSYVDESCPGERNPDDRVDINLYQRCDLMCGACGGGGRAETISMNGQEKGRDFHDMARREMGGSFRLDQRTAPHAQAAEPFPVSYMPTVEWGGRAYLADMLDYPGVFTTLKTAMASKNPGARVRTQLRDRLGWPSYLGVNGLTKDDLLDDAWDQMDRTLEFCKAGGVQVMTSPQFSYYNGLPTASWLYNSSRSMEWYSRCVEVGFPVVALDTPPTGQNWYLADYLRFIKRNKVKCLAISLQTISGISAYHVKTAREFHEELDPDVSLLFFGTNTLPAMIAIARCYPGRNMAFSNVEPYAKAAFGRLVTGTLAGYKNKGRCPAHRRKNPVPDAPCDCVSVGMSKSEVFVWNVERMRLYADKAMQVSRQAAERGSRGPSAARPARPSAGSARAKPRRRRRRGSRSAAGSS